MQVKARPTQPRTLSSDVVLESGSVLELDSSPYFEDSDSNPLDSDLE